MARKVHQIMTVDVACAKEAVPISVAWELMERRQVRHLPVVAADDGNRLVGFVSDRDLLAAGKHSQAPVASVMNRTPVSIDPQTTIREVCQLFLKKRFDAAPVADGEGNLLGLVTTSDLLRTLAS
ncbi:MAG: CBS domain-containing protein [Myxococcaceae bacterium]